LWGGASVEEHSTQVTLPNRAHNWFRDAPVILGRVTQLADHRYQVSYQRHDLAHLSSEGILAVRRLKSGLHIAHPDIYRTSTRLKLPSDSLTLKRNQSRPASEASEKTVKEHRPFVAKVVRAFTEPLHFIKTNKEEIRVLIGKNFQEQRPGRIGARALRSRNRRSENLCRYEFRSRAGSVGVYQAAVQKVSHRLNSECSLFRFFTCSMASRLF